MLLLFIVEILIIGYIFYYLNNYLRRDFVENFENKHVFITGTDSGIGRELALALDRRGLTVYAGCYTENGVVTLRQEASSKMKILPIDVTDNESIDRARNAIERQLTPNKGIWALVNNAGIFGGAVFEWSTIEDYETVMDVNFYGLIRVTNAFLPLVKRAQGRIVNITGISGRCPVSPGPYGCSGFAAECYSNGLRRHLTSSGVKVSIIEPAYYKTPMWSKTNVLKEFNRQWKNLSNDKKTEYGDEYKACAETKIMKLVEDPPLSSGNQIEDVVCNIIHAIGSTRPRARYVSGLDGHILYRPAAVFLPDWMTDFIFKTIFKN